MKLRARDTISAPQEARIREAVTGARSVDADGILVRAFDRVDHCSILVTGMAARVRQMEDGRRQICELHVAGDFVDLHSYTLKYLEHDVVALTACEFAIVPHAKVRAITEEDPHLARVYWFTTNLDAAIHRERVVSLGRREAAGRMAHLFCEMHIRLALVGLVAENSFNLPLTQLELAECLGLSSVHVNRTLMQLRAEGLFQFKDGRLTILDFEGLARMAEFDPGYLYLDRRPD